MFDLSLIKNIYDEMNGKIDSVRKIIKRPLTITEKILYNEKS